MSRYVVDCSAALHLAAHEIAVPANHRLLAPTLLRSQVLSQLHEQGLDGAIARERLARVRRLKIRLLGDAVLQRRAWEIADRLGWESTYDAEYLALTQLQADAFVTLDEQLAKRAAEVVTVASIDALVR